MQNLLSFSKKNPLYIFIPAIILLFLTLAGCKKDNPTVDPVPIQDGGVYILNEGNFQWGNGSIDYLRNADNSYTNDIFKSVNNRSLGDVVQSITVVDDRGYIVVNNSGKIEVVDMSGFTSAGTITGLTSPRYLIPVGNSKAYVSDLYSNSISIVDLSSLQVTGHIPLRGSSEEMLVKDQVAYVTNTRTSFLYLINTQSNTLSDSIAIGFAANSIVEDLHGNLWIMCSGNQSQSQTAGLYCINPSTKQVVRHFDLGVYLQIWDKVRINSAKDKLYYMNSGIWCLDITATALSSAPLIAQNGRQFHGLGIQPATENIYVSDAIDYVQHGKVFRYKKDGTLIDSMSAGIIPSGFFFK